MRIIVGGESRKSGKTTIVCRIIEAFAGAGWTAVKVSPHLHGVEAAKWSLTGDDSSGDTKRYVIAGAQRALLYCGPVEDGLDELLRVLGGAPNWIVETTSAAHLIPHDLAILVAAPGGRAAKVAADFPPHIRVELSDAGLVPLVREHWKS